MNYDNEDYKNPLSEPSNYGQSILMAEYSATGAALGGSIAGGEGAAVGSLIGLVPGYVHGTIDRESGNGLGTKQAEFIKELLGGE